MPVPVHNLCIDAYACLPYRYLTARDSDPPATRLALPLLTVTLPHVAATPLQRSGRATLGSSIGRYGSQVDNHELIWFKVSGLGLRFSVKALKLISIVTLVAATGKVTYEVVTTIVR